MNTSRQIIKQLIPPIVSKMFKKPNKYGFFGNYTDWQSATLDSEGYDSNVIFERIKESAMKVKQGLVTFERDGVTFDTKDHSWPVIAMLLLSASQNSNCLDIVDFGGSLGSSYFQNIGLLKNLKEIHWAIVEQDHIYEYGKQHMEDKILTFHKDTEIDKILQSIRPQVFLAGSSIQYIKEPYELLEKIINFGFESIIFDRTPFFIDKEIIVVQKVSPRIYNASYPARIMNVNKFKQFFSQHGYDIIAECDQGTMSYNKKDGQILLKHLTFSLK